MMKFTKLSGWFFGLVLLALLSINVSAQAQKKTDGIYGPMNYGLDREDGIDFNELRYRYEIKRIIAEKEATVIEIGKEMKKCRTSECRAPLHKKIEAAEFKMRAQLAEESRINQRRIELINKYWEGKEKKKLKYFP